MWPKCGCGAIAHCVHLPALGVPSVLKFHGVVNYCNELPCFSSAEATQVQISGALQEASLRRAVRDSMVCLCVASPKWRHSGVYFNDCSELAAEPTSELLSYSSPSGEEWVMKARMSALLLLVLLGAVDGTAAPQRAAWAVRRLPESPVSRCFSLA